MYRRFVVDGAQVEIQPEGGVFGLGKRKPFVAQALDFSQGGLQFLCRETTNVKEKDSLQLTIHLKGERDWMRTTAEVVAARKVENRPFLRVSVHFTDIDPQKARHLRELEHQYLPAQDRETSGQTGRLRQTFQVPVESGRDVDAAKSAEAERFGEVRSGDVKRPVALLELIATLEKFEVNDELVLLLLEAAEQGIAIEDLAGHGRGGDATPIGGATDEAGGEGTESGSGRNRPIPIYRMDEETRFHFSEEGLPVAAPVDHLFFSGIEGSRSFACEIQFDRMRQSEGPSFERGEIVVFSKDGDIEDGCFAYTQTREGDDFSQIFLPDEEHVRIRHLNPSLREMVFRRSEVKFCYRMVLRLRRY